MELVRFWNHLSNVRSYSRKDTLQLPELNFIMEHKDFLKESDVLDLGIGAGRSTLFFAPLAKSYTGSDISENMIEECKTKFSYTKNINLLVEDATDLKNYRDNSIDFVLFSFNGIDNIFPESKRIQCLNEINRVLKSRGLYFFSTHNSLFIEEYYKFHFFRHPRRLYREYLRKRQIIKENGSLENIQEKIKKGPLFFFEGMRIGKEKFLQYFITPNQQMTQLKKIGFEFVCGYSLDGKKLGVSEIENCKDPWIYYLVRKP